MTEYILPQDIRDLDGQVFPDALENDPLVYFHGTSESAFRSIAIQGFRFMSPLPSISFVCFSPFALGIASDKRSAESPNGAVLAVRFQNTTMRGIEVENTLLYLRDLSIQPEIIGFCIIPEAYRHW